VTTLGNVLRIQADVSNLAAVRQFVREQGAQAGANQEAIDDLVSAVDESVTNSIVHGYAGAAGWVEVEIDLVERSLIVHLRDQARPFDPTSMPDPDVTLPLEERPFHGMGIYLVRQLTDSVAYRHSDNGNELTLTKAIDQRGR
jgi:serine/threonine-protein kinase RsbW